jgi:hypothetical protein
MVFWDSCSLGDIHGNGKIVSQERSVNDFYGVTLDGVGNVNIHYSEDHKVIVTTDSNMQDIIVIKSNENILYINKKNNNGFNPTELKIDVYMPEIKNIYLNGVGNIKIGSGKTSDFEINLSGVGNIEVQNYEAENVNIIHSGTGDIKIWVTKSLTGIFSGVGNILYKGDPVINNINKTGIGNIKKL